jgi:predicted Zn-ribbon and HTH transcriptional regulator
VGSFLILRHKTNLAQPLSVFFRLISRFIKYAKALSTRAGIFSLSLGLIFNASEAQAQAANNAAYQQFKKNYPEAEAALVNAETRYLLEVHEKGRAVYPAPARCRGCFFDTRAITSSACRQCRLLPCQNIDGRY